MRNLIVACLLLAAIGCDKVVKEERLQSHIEQREVDCDYAGFCLNYQYYGGDPGYKYGFSTSCDGHQAAKVSITPVHRKYASGAESTLDDIAVVERVGVCR